MSHELISSILLLLTSQCDAADANMIDTCCPKLERHFTDWTDPTEMHLEVAKKEEMLLQQRIKFRDIFQLDLADERMTCEGMGSSEIRSGLQNNKLKRR